MAAKNRVSAKQRLELVRDALHRLNVRSVSNAGLEIDDYVSFVESVEEALYAELTPKSLHMASEIINEPSSA